MESGPGRVHQDYEGVDGAGVLSGGAWAPWGRRRGPLPFPRKRTDPIGTV